MSNEFKYPTIKFSYPFSKLHHIEGQRQLVKLLQVIETDYIDLTQEFRDYDTDFGKFPLPKKGPCIILIFFRTGGIFTTVRRSIPHKVEYYKRMQGQDFQVELSLQPNEN